MTKLFTYGANWGDCIYAAQRLFTLGYCDWCTDVYNKPLVEFLIEYTNCPVENGIYLETPASSNIGRAKFMPYRKWKVNQWRTQYPGYSHYEVYKPNLRCKKHAALQAGNGRVQTIVTSKNRTRNKIILISCDTWNDKRRYKQWNQVKFPPGYKVVEIVYKNPGETNYEKWRSDNIERTAEHILAANMVVGVSSFTTCFSASLGVPSVKLCQNDYDKTYLGVSVFKGIDLHVSNSSSQVSAAINGLSRRQ